MVMLTFSCTSGGVLPSDWMNFDLRGHNVGI
jgi:hypothetical protein